jgi:hypothetical protein
MADNKRALVYYEGDDDRVVLEGLQRMGLLPAGWDIAQRGKDHPGKDGLVRQLLPFIRPLDGVGGMAVVLVDLDDLTRERLAIWFRRQVEDSLHGTGVTIQAAQSESGRVHVLAVSGGDRTGRAVLVPVGLLDDVDFRTAQAIERFAIDDHILKLAQEQRVYAAVSELESVPYELAMHKLSEVALLLRQNGLRINHSKRLLQILRTIAAFRPSSAALIERLMKKASETLSIGEVRLVFHPLIDDLEDAARLLGA